MLQAAPATLAEMSARWLGTTRTRRQQLDKLDRLSVTTSPHAGPVARRRQRNVKGFSGMLGDAIPGGADAQDRDLKGAAPDRHGLTGGPAAPHSPNAAAQSGPLSPSTRLPVN
jgi:hypothetical protein